MQTHEIIENVKLEMSKVHNGFSKEENHGTADDLLISMIKLLAGELEEDVSDFISDFLNLPKWYA